MEKKSLNISSLFRETLNSAQKMLKDLSSDQNGYGRWMEQEQSPMVYFVTPLFRFLRSIFMTHSQFQFDPKTRLFYHHPGSWSRKVICMTLELILIVHMWIESQLTIGLVQNKKIVGLFKILGVFYVALALAFHYGLMFKGDQINDILNFIQRMTLAVSRAGCKLPSKKIIKSMNKGLLIITIIHAILFTIVNCDGLHSTSLQEGLEGYLKNCGDQAARKIFNLIGTNVTSIQLREYKLSDELMEDNLIIIKLIGIIHLIISFMASLCWMMAFLMITMWALLFCKVLHNFFDLISHTSIRNTLEDIRKFNKITEIIDQFNKVFGWTVLTGVLVGVLHFSVNVVDLFQSSQPWTQRLMVGAGLIKFGFLLLTSAQVNHAAGNITEVIKARYGNEEVWRDYHGNCTETTHGMILVLHEVEVNRIGFSGLGFFTVTYSFIGTVLSLISTYSIVVVQFQ